MEELDTDVNFIGKMANVDFNAKIGWQLKLTIAQLCTMKQNPLAGFISGICVIFMILNQVLGYFMFWDTKTTPKMMLIIIYYPFPNVKFENG